MKTHLNILNGPKKIKRPPIIPKLVDNRLLQISEPKSVTSTLNKVSTIPISTFSNIKDRSNEVLKSRHTRYALSNIFGLIIIIIFLFFGFIWHKRLSFERFISQNIHLTGPEPYEQIKSYNFMEKEFKSDMI